MTQQILTIAGKGTNVFKYLELVSKHQGKKTLKELKNVS
jgi:hypothetical protein